MKKNRWLLLICLCVVLVSGGCGNKKSKDGGQAPDWRDMAVTGSMEIRFGEQFSVDYYDAYALLTIADERYLVVPEKCAVPNGVDADITVIKQPVSHAYLAATSAMDLVRELGAISAISFTGTNRDGWYIKEAVDAFDAGTMHYAGKYSAPDFEQLVAGSCDLAIESTMIYHNPEIKEQLEQNGIPVLVERSSYESHPLGRLEWIKVYGLLFGKSDEAAKYFDNQADKLTQINTDGTDGASVVFFYITSNGAVSVRKSGDYISKMIQLAGGSIIAWDDEGEEESAMSSMTIQMEAFYADARDADYLIYNSAIEGELFDIGQLLEKSPLLADFKAVQNGYVFCTGKNMFQESTGVGDMILDIHTILENPDTEDGELVYLYRLNQTGIKPEYQ